MIYEKKTLHLHFSRTVTDWEVWPRQQQKLLQLLSRSPKKRSSNEHFQKKDCVIQKLSPFLAAKRHCLPIVLLQKLGESELQTISLL